MLKMANLTSAMWLAIFVHLYANSNGKQYDVMMGVIGQDLTLSQKSERLYCHMLTHGNNYYSGVGCNVNA